MPEAGASVVADSLMRRANLLRSGGADDTAPPDARVLDAVGDVAFARRAAAGDRDAYGELVRRHEAAAYRVAWGIVRSREDAEDAVQEAFVRAWRALGDFDPARPFRPWLITNAGLTAGVLFRTKREAVFAAVIADVGHRSKCA